MREVLKSEITVLEQNQCLAGTAGSRSGKFTEGNFSTPSGQGARTLIFGAGMPVGTNLCIANDTVTNRLHFQLPETSRTFGF